MDKFEIYMKILLRTAENKLLLHSSLQIFNFTHFKTNIHVVFSVKKRHEGHPRRRPQSVPTVWGRRPRRRKRLCWRRRGSRQASLERSRSKCSPRSPSAASWCASQPPRSAATPSRCACPGTFSRRASRTT
jgi:hypothetical protein